MMYGIQPIWPSEYASFRFVNFSSWPENNQSLMDAMALLKLNVACTAAGASGDADGIDDDDPMCMLIQTSLASHAAKNGSQWSVWIDGRPNLGGISLKQTAWTLRAALRSISSTASCTSHRGTMMSGIKRPPLSPHHSSTIQSLYARM